MSFGKASPTATFQPQQAEQGNTSVTGQWPHGQLAHIAVHTPIQARISETNQSLPVYSNSSPQTAVHLSQGYGKGSNPHIYGRQLCFESNNSVQPITHSLPEDSTEGQMAAKESGYSSSTSPTQTTMTPAIPYSTTTDHWSLALDSQKQWTSLPRPQSATVSVEEAVNVGSQSRMLSPQVSSGCYTSPRSSLTQVSPSSTAALSTSSWGIGIAKSQSMRNQLEGGSANNGGERTEERLHTILDYDSEECQLNQQKDVLNADEATKLLLNFSQNVSSTGETSTETTTTSVHSKTLGSEKPPASETANTMFDSNQIAESIVSDVVESLAADRAQEETIPAGGASAIACNQPARNSRTYFRAPGLEGPNVSDAVDSNVRVCPICSFSCSSKFHYNSHMNTHSFHQCTICNYTSRTEGRLRKHLQDSHTWEQRLAAGIDEAPPPANSTPQTPNRNPASEQSPNFHGDNMPTSIVEIVNRAAAAANVQPNSGSSTDALLRMVDNYNNQIKDNSPMGFKSMESSNLANMPNALDQIRALTERTSNLLASPPPNQSISSTLNGIFGMDNGVGFQLQEHGEGIPNGGEINVIEGDQPAPPRRAGRPKSYKCKTCGMVTKSKEERWEHAKSHIPADKQLKCECGFVTEYKHHLEYHMRNHTGSKPFKCNICNYVCVNKSMLNSHMKSHTPVYQFSCQNCTYKTKYCHSLKMHLRKYNHTRTPGIFDSDSHDEDFAEGGRPESDDSTTNSLQQLAEQYNNSIGSSNEQEDPKGGMKVTAENTNNHPALNSMLLQPIVTSASMQNYASQMLLRHQHLEHISELMRAANSNAISNVIACQKCDFTASSNEDIVRHNMFAHILVNQHQQPASLANLYHNLAAAQQQQHNPAQLLLGQQPTVHSTPSDLLNGSMTTASIDLAAQLQAAQQEMAFRVQDENRRQAIVAFANNIVASSANPENKNGIAALSNHHQLGTEFIVEEEHNMSPASEHQDSAAESSASPSGSKISADGGTSSGSPSSEATPGGSRKRKQSKTNRLEQISEKLQGKASPEQKRCKSTSESLPQPIPSHPNTSTMQINPEKTTENGNFSSLLARLNQVQDQHRQHTMPYTCQHCMMAFQDRALYQIHLGYHGYETPFKCNRCGHLSQSSLEFNLHLYESNHI